MSITEQSSSRDHLEQLSTTDLLLGINEEDYKVAEAVKKVIPEITTLVDLCLPRMQSGGRLFYIGAGTSGRLGVVDASECPPTYGVAPDVVIGLIAGGDAAIRKAVEGAEDNPTAAWEDMALYQPTAYDTVIGIAASGRTPYVIGGLKQAREAGLLTGCITCNPNSEVTQVAEVAIVPVVGPEFVTGSTRMKAGTAQKLVLNMISTTLMIRLGHVRGNKMVDMQLSNAKLVDRGTRMVVEETALDYDTAKEWLLKYGSVRKAVDAYRGGDKK